MSNVDGWLTVLINFGLAGYIVYWLTNRAEKKLDDILLELKTLVSLLRKNSGN